jgi:hypothetical protein
MHLKETQVAARIVAGRLSEALEAVRAELRLRPTHEPHKRKLKEIEEMQLKEIQVAAAAAAAEKAAFDEKVAATAAAMRCAYDDRFYHKRAAVDDDIFQVAAAAAAERVACDDHVFPVIHQGPDGYPMILLYSGQLGCIPEAAQGRDDGGTSDGAEGDEGADDDEEWADCLEGEEVCLSENMGVDDDGGSVGCEGGENDEGQVDKESPHDEMVGDFD